MMGSLRSYSCKYSSQTNQPLRTGLCWLRSCTSVDGSSNSRRVHSWICSYPLPERLMPVGCSILSPFENKTSWFGCLVRHRLDDSTSVGTDVGDFCCSWYFVWSWVEALLGRRYWNASTLQSCRHAPFDRVRWADPTFWVVPNTPSSSYRPPAKLPGFAHFLAVWHALGDVVTTLTERTRCVVGQR